MVRAFASIRNADLDFENSPVRITANRSCPEIKLAGLSVGPFDEGNDYEVCYWAALELVKSGVARFHTEDMLDVAKLGKIQWMERVQTAGQMSKLPEGFYPKLRRYIAEARQEIANNPEKMREFERADQLRKDIVNSRLKKIVSIATTPVQTESTLRNLTVEERLLYEQLYQVINNWKTQILNHKEKETNG
jgi:GINS complex protein helical bundle domain